MLHMRSEQREALIFIDDAFYSGYNDIVISAPTGIGKSGIGIATCLWANSFTEPNFERGGYYLITQKLLQDQLEHDVCKLKPEFRAAISSLKSGSEYVCDTFSDCLIGGTACGINRCQQRNTKTCPYLTAKSKFDSSAVAVTNYPYLFTEHAYARKLKPRNVLIADECHSVDRQITNFTEVTIDSVTLDAWAPDCRDVPTMPEIEQFADWLRQNYIVQCTVRTEWIIANLNECGYRNPQLQAELIKLNNHIERTKAAIASMEKFPDDWVYWQEPEQDGALKCTAKPINAASFTKELIEDMGNVRVYMSAYPGPKDVFCRNLGLSKVAWLELDSPFPVQNRLVHLTTVGSLNRRTIDATMPRLLDMCATILEAHPDEKGIIHSHTYALGQKIHDYFATTPLAKRILFSSKASERTAIFNRHKTSTEPTVIISPSMTEGFSFDDDLARFQIIAKVPYPYLGDRQVAARMEQDPEWYTLQTIQTLIQAVGRIVRSNDDYGSTYILDSDFYRLYRENSKFFPRWWTEALQWYSNT